MKKIAVMLVIMFAAGCVNKEITKTKDPSKLTIQQVIANLTSGDFRRTLSARTQLSRLTKTQKITVLKQVINNPKPSIRMTAISEFQKLGDDACPFLQKKAVDDPDPDVKQAAADASKDCKAPAN